MDKKSHQLEIKSQLVQMVREIEELCLSESDPEKIIGRLKAMETVLQATQAKAVSVISAQVSLYPLKQLDIYPTINETIELFTDYGLTMVPSTMSTVITGSEELLWKAMHDAFLLASQHGETVMLLTVSNACPKPVKKKNSEHLKNIIKKGGWDERRFSKGLDDERPNCYQ